MLKSVHKNIHHNTTNNNTITLWSEKSNGTRKKNRLTCCAARGSPRRDNSTPTTTTISPIRWVHVVPIRIRVVVGAPVARVERNAGNRLRVEDSSACCVDATAPWPTSAGSATARIPNFGTANRSVVLWKKRKTIVSFITSP